MTVVLPRRTDAVQPAAAAPRSGLRALVPHRADRPAWIRLAAFVIAVTAIVLVVVLAAGSRSAHAGIDQIGNHTAPNVEAADDLSYELADMDASLANVLLAGDDSAQAGMRKAASAAYETDRTLADTDLRQATEVAGSDASLQKSIQSVMDQLGQYEAYAGEAMLLNNTQHDPAGQPSADVLLPARQATDTMKAMLANAQLIVGDDHAGARGQLEDAYKNVGHTAVNTRVGLAILGLALLGTLLGLQLWLRVTVRRRINVGLAVATVVVAAVIIGGFVALGSASHQLTVAKRDAFDSLVVLDDARWVSADANADESRYLVDPDRADQYQAAFLRKSQQLVDVGNSVDDYDSAFAAAMQDYQRKHSVDFSGDFGTELKNITFPGEAQAALDTLTTLQAYEVSDRTIRADNRNNDLAAAIAFDTGAAPGQSDYTFNQYTQALGQLININHHAFTTAIAAGADALAGWNGLLPYGAAVLILAALIIGVLPRLAEYR